MKRARKKHLKLEHQSGVHTDDDIYSSSSGERARDSPIDQLSVSFPFKKTLCFFNLSSLAHGVEDKIC